MVLINGSSFSFQPKLLLLLSCHGLPRSQSQPSPSYPWQEHFTSKTKTKKVGTPGRPREKPTLTPGRNIIAQVINHLRMDVAPWCYKWVDWVGIEYIWVVLGIEPYTVLKIRKVVTPPGKTPKKVGIPGRPK